MKRLQLPLEEYEKDIKQAEKQGRVLAYRSFLTLLRVSRHVPADAVNTILDSSEWSSSQQREVIDLLGLATIAENMFKQEGSDL